MSGVVVPGQCDWRRKPEVRSGVLRGELPAGIHDRAVCPDAYWWSQQYRFDGVPLATELGGVVLSPAPVVTVARDHHGSLATLRVVVMATGFVTAYLL